MSVKIIEKLSNSEDWSVTTARIRRRDDIYPLKRLDREELARGWSIGVSAPYNWVLITELRWTWNPQEFKHM